jgi:hypothetical protein
MMARHRMGPPAIPTSDTRARRQASRLRRAALRRPEPGHSRVGGRPCVAAARRAFATAMQATVPQPTLNKPRAWLRCCCAPCEWLLVCLRTEQKRSRPAQCVPRESASRRQSRAALGRTARFIGVRTAARNGECCQPTRPSGVGPPVGERRCLKISLLKSCASCSVNSISSKQTRNGSSEKSPTGSMPSSRTMPTKSGGASHARSSQT